MLTLLEAALVFLCCPMKTGALALPSTQSIRCLWYSAVITPPSHSWRSFTFGCSLLVIQHTYIQPLSPLLITSRYKIREPECRRQDWVHVPQCTEYWRILQTRDSTFGFHGRRGFIDPLSDYYISLSRTRLHGPKNSRPDTNNDNIKFGTFLPDPMHLPRTASSLQTIISRPGAVICR